MDFKALKRCAKLNIKATLEVDFGNHFAPTSFPDLGPAEYELPSGKSGLTVESFQSMANRLESVCWDTVKKDWVEPLKGLPLVNVSDTKGEFLTNSILESHRLASAYILNGKDKSMLELLKKELYPNGVGAVDFSKLYVTLLKYDPNSLLHGLFLAQTELANGRYKLPRALSAFIEAEDTSNAPVGGVRFDIVNPKGDSHENFGHVPFHKERYTANHIYAGFKLYLAQIRGYGLGEEAEKFLIAFALYKILKFLAEGLRLRSDCDFRVVKLEVLNIEGWKLPTLEELEEKLPQLIQEIADKDQFAPIDNAGRKTRFTTVIFEQAEKKKKTNKETDDNESGEE